MEGCTFSESMMPYHYWGTFPLISDNAEAFYVIEK
jgi:hypothetical protein